MATATAILLFATPACAPAANDTASNAARTSGGEETPAPASSPAPVGTGPGQRPFAAIGAAETIRLVGTEPFWGGTVTSGQLLYTTPENQSGEPIAVRRFAGNNGLGFSGTRGGKPLDLTITPGLCSDGMSDRSYPFTATLKLGDEQRNGCAWTDGTPFRGSQNP